MTENTNKIAFIKNGSIEQILDTDTSIAELITGDSLKIDVTLLPNGMSAKIGDVYNTEENTITLMTYQEEVQPRHEE
jgi:hypothetical protein